VKLSMQNEKISTDCRSIASGPQIDDKALADWVAHTTYGIVCR
jgi:hypothetical protein